MSNNEYKIKIPKLRKLIVLYLLTKTMIEIEANERKLWVRPRKILVKLQKPAKPVLQYLRY